ncbi:MAG: MFS transporter [Actinomycetota bacterium]
MSRDTPKNLALHFGWVSLFQDLGSKMVVPIVPLYLTLGLGASPLVVGAVDGLAAATVALVAPIAGRLSTPARAPNLVRLGYGLSSIAKVALVIATSWIAVLAVRVFDRAGKGVRDAPRDLILAASRPDKTASAFGLQQAMDKLGGAIGPLVGLVIYEAFDGSFDAVFFVAFIPCLLSVGLLLRPLPTPGAVADAPRSASMSSVQRRRIALLAIGAAGTVPVALLIVRALEQGAGVATVLLAFALLRFATAVFAVPGGRLADRIGAQRAIVVGQLILAVALLAALIVPDEAALWAVLPLVGTSDALLRGPVKVWMIEGGPAASRGTVLGAWTGANAVAGLIAGVGVGVLWGDDGTVPIVVSAAIVITVVVAIAGGVGGRTEHAL